MTDLVSDSQAGPPEYPPTVMVVHPKERRSKLFSLYLRPWVLDATLASNHVPYILDLDVLPRSVQQPLYRKRMR